MEATRNKLYFVSDAHLGSGADTREREAELCRLLESMKADAQRLVLLGDMFDFWFTYKHTVPRGHIRLLGKLAELSDAGVETHYYIGNHDMWLFDYLREEAGTVMHSDPDIMEFDGKRFLVGHGDGLDRNDRSYLRLRRLFRSRTCQWLFARLSPSLTFPIARRWSDTNKGSHRRNTAHGYGHRHGGIAEYCLKRLENEKFDYCVFGHMHMPTSTTLKAANGREVQYVNSGDWLYHRTYALYADGKLSLHKI